MQDTENTHLQKRAALDDMPLSYWEIAREQEPITSASAPEKFDRAKARALYAADLLPYVAAYLDPVELRLHKDELTDKGASATQELNSLLRRRKHFTYMIFDSMASRARHSGAPCAADAYKSICWVRDACLNQQVKFHGYDQADEVDEVRQGLFSGPRACDVILTGTP